MIQLSKLYKTFTPTITAGVVSDIQPVSIHTAAHKAANCITTELLTGTSIRVTFIDVCAHTSM